MRMTALEKPSACSQRAPLLFYICRRVSSVSSAPLLELGDDEVDVDTGKRAEAKLAPDSAIRVHEEHDDTIVSLAWSAHNAWVYASLSYPGKVVVLQVPSAEKYRVLL